MAVRKLSEIANSPVNPVAADTFVGVHGGNTDYQFSLTQISGGLASSGSIRNLLTSNVTFYVSTTGSDSNNGSIASPWATLDHALTAISSTNDLGGFTVTIQLANGTYAGAYSGASFLGGGFVIIQGDTGNVANVTLVGALTAVNYTILGVFSPTETLIGVAYVTLDCSISPTTHALVTDNTFCQLYSAQCKFVGTANSTVTFIDSAYASIYIGFTPALGYFGGTVIQGPWKSCILTPQGTGVFCTGYMTGDITLTTSSFSIAFVILYDQSLCAFQGATFSGTATGTQFTLFQGSSFDSGGVTCPGSITGICDPSSSFNGSLPFPTTVSVLNTNFPAASYQGSNMFVTDSTLGIGAGLGLTVAGTGANKVPVYSDGTNWIIG